MNYNFFEMTYEISFDKCDSDFLSTMIILSIGYYFCIIKSIHIQ